VVTDVLVKRGDNRVVRVLTRNSGVHFSAEGLAAPSSRPQLLEIAHPQATAVIDASPASCARRRGVAYAPVDVRRGKRRYRSRDVTEGATWRVSSISTRRCAGEARARFQAICAS
jgi:hypothetical protein